MIPVVVLQTIAANLGSMMTPIGNPQNLYLYELSGMSIGQFILWMLPFTMIAAALLLVSLLFIRDKGAEISVTADKKVRKDTRKRINIIIHRKIMGMYVAGLNLPPPSNSKLSMSSFYHKPPSNATS